MDKQRERTNQRMNKQTNVIYVLYIIYMSILNVDNDNPKLNFIKPCLCSGSMKWVHENCLKKWILQSHRYKCRICGHKYKIIKHGTLLRMVCNSTGPRTESCTDAVDHWLRR